MRAGFRRQAVGFAAGLFQGPAFLWGQFSALVGATTGEAGLVRWSALGLTLALVFGLAVLSGDRLGARPLILSVCAGPPAKVPRANAIRANLRDPLLVLTALAAFFAQAVLFAGVPGLPTVLHDYQLSASVIGYVQGSAIAAALLVARPRKLGHSAFGRLVPMVALIGADIAAAVVAITDDGHSRALIVIVCAGCGLAFITMELLEQWSQSIAQIQARQHAPATHDYVRQALWLLLANLGAIIGAEWIATLATNSLTRWLLALSIAAALFLGLSLAWYEIHQRIQPSGGRPHHHGGRHRAPRGGRHRAHPHRAPAHRS